MTLKKSAGSKKKPAGSKKSRTISEKKKAGLRARSVRPHRRPAGVKLPPGVAALVKQIAGVIDEQKGENVRVIPLENHVADAFVIATTSGIRHLHSLADHLIDKMREHGIDAHHVVGHVSTALSNRGVLVDFTDVVVHLFTEEGREFYGLDRLMEERPSG